jgi:hypothetical protein
LPRGAAEWLIKVFRTPICEAHRAVQWALLDGEHTGQGDAEKGHGGDEHKTEHRRKIAMSGWAAAKIMSGMNGSRVVRSLATNHIQSTADPANRPKMRQELQP